MRFLFVAARTGSVRQYVPLIAELAGRGHEIHLAFSRPPEEGAAEALVGGVPRVTQGLAPRRHGLDGWTQLAWLARAFADLARYSHPRYDAAPVLRRRITQKVLWRLDRLGGLEPVAHWLSRKLARRLSLTTDARLSERVVRAAARLEEAIPSSGRIERYLRSLNPDAVLVTDVVRYCSRQVEYLKSARRLGIPAGTCVASWDNLTNKGLLKFVPERVFVWNGVQRREAVELHGIPDDRVVATGAQAFDEWFGRKPSTERKQFVREVGLDPASPYVLYVCSSPFVTNESDDEVRFVSRWIESLRASGDERVRRLGVLVRPHPIGNQWRHVDLGRFENAVVWPRRSPRHVTERAREGFFDSLFHSAAVVGINTTAMIEAAIVGKSVLTVLAPEFAQESTLHFHYLLAENGGFLHVSSSLEGHVAQLARVLDESAAGAERRERFVESFVRPHGLEQPATPILVNAVEELATLDPERRTRPGVMLLRGVLYAEAVLCSLTILAQEFRRRVGRRGQRLLAKARYRRPIPSRTGV